MHNPPHPGEVLRELYMVPLGLPVSKTAKAPRVSKSALPGLLRGTSRLTPGMALRLSKAFNTTPESWLAMQQQYGLWNAKRDCDLSDVEVLTGEP